MSDIFSGLAGAALGGLASVFTSSQNKKAVKATNEMNLQIARETNQANKALYEQQFADQLKLQEMQNVYNSAPSQVERLREAGVNPALAFGQGSTAASSVGVPSAAPAIGATMQAPLTEYSDTFINSALAALSAVATSSKDMSEAQGKRIDNQYQLESFKSRLDDLMADVRQKEANIKFVHASKEEKKQMIKNLQIEHRRAGVLYDILEGQKSELSRSALLQNQQVQANIDLMNEQAKTQRQEQLTSELGRVLSLHADSRAYAELDSLVSRNLSECQLLAAQKHLTIKDVENYSNRTVNQLLNNDLLRQTLEQNGVRLKMDEKLQKLIRKQLFWNINQMRQNFNNPFRYLFGGSGLSAPVSGAAHYFK